MVSKLHSEIFVCFLRDLPTACTQRAEALINTILPSQTIAVSVDFVREASVLSSIYHCCTSILVTQIQPLFLYNSERSDGMLWRHIVCAPELIAKLVRQGTHLQTACTLYRTT